ncbi:MAG: TetR/AcrR family transcriptional regulator [Paenibacillaceae bacterium]
MSDKPDLLNSDQTHVTHDERDMSEEQCYTHLCTRDKILQVSIDLMSEKGYKTVTTKEIAQEAGISEMTVFRHFGSKLKILEDAIDKYSCATPLKQLFEERLLHELEVDLLEISRAYHDVLSRNKKIMLISLKEVNNIPVLKEYLSMHTTKFEVGLIDYFTQMQELGKVIKIKPETLAQSFLSLNFGAFMENIISEDEVTKSQCEEHIVSGVKIFARGLTP